MAHHHHHDHHDHHDHLELSKGKKFKVPSSMKFQSKRYHGCSICISGIVSERYTDPSRVPPRQSSDMLGFVKFRSNVERDFMTHMLLIMKHLEENRLLAPDGRQWLLHELMKAFGMPQIEAGSSLAARPADTDPGVHKEGVAKLCLELALALPGTYWAGLGQHQAGLEPGAFASTSSKVHELWAKVVRYLEAELRKPRDAHVAIEAGTRVEARWAGRKAWFPATVTLVHGDEEAFDLKYDSTFARSNAGKANKKAAKSDGRAASAGFSSRLLDNGEVERLVPRQLVRTFPETPRTPREDGLLRVTAHLRRVLRLGTERPVELAHHRRHYMPPVQEVMKASELPEALRRGGGAVLWQKQKLVPVQGLMDVNRTKSLVYRGKYGWPDRDDSFGR